MIIFFNKVALVGCNLFSMLAPKIRRKPTIYMVVFDQSMNCLINIQEIGWFDEEAHNTGALCARLSTSAEAVASAGGGNSL